jgi:hypothetical protein
MAQYGVGKRPCSIFIDVSVRGLRLLVVRVYGWFDVAVVDVSPIDFLHIRLSNKGIVSFMSLS